MVTAGVVFLLFLSVGIVGSIIESRQETSRRREKLRQKLHRRARRAVGKK